VPSAVFGDSVRFCDQNAQGWRCGVVARAPLGETQGVSGFVWIGSVDARPFVIWEPGALMFRSAFALQFLRLLDDERAPTTEPDESNRLSTSGAQHNCEEVRRGTVIVSVTVRNMDFRARRWNISCNSKNDFGFNW
jgi:hypothetical protein